jgi:hypothetical protein
MRCGRDHRRKTSLADQSSDPDTRKKITAIALKQDNGLRQCRGLGPKIIVVIENKSALDRNVRRLVWPSMLHGDRGR